jgi:FMN phosphatase YigB (HAD superfamily)
MNNGIIFDWVGTLSRGCRDLYADSRKVLDECRARGYNLGLISIAGHGIDARIEDIKATGIQDYFGNIIVDTVKTADMYRNCMKRLGTVPSTTWVVDDRMLKGIKVGNSLGCGTCWIQAGRYANELPNEETGEPTATVTSIVDLLSIV